MTATGKSCLKPASSYPAPCQIQALLLWLIIIACSSPANAADPDTSVLSFIKLDYKQFLDAFVEDDRTQYAQPTAAASSQWAAVGTDSLSYDAYETWGFGITTHYNYSTSPVYVMGPFNGTPYNTITLTPPPIANAAEEFGASLGIHGDRIAVGSTRVVNAYWATRGHPDPTIGSGRVHLYSHNGTHFDYERTIVHGGLMEGFGASLALGSNTLLVGRPGAVPGAVDLFDPNTGHHITTFTSQGGADNFGEVVALTDNLALVGASGSNAVYVYRHDGAGNWNAAGTLDSPGIDSRFGAAIAVSGNRVLVGAPGADRAFIFEDDGDANWPVVAEITAFPGWQFGTAVALVGNTAFISASSLPTSGGLSGGVGRFELGENGVWSLVSHKLARNPQNGDGFGNVISASATMLAVVQNGLIEKPGELLVYTAQADIWDGDSDTVSDYGDNCGDAYNPEQEDLDGDDMGDACDSDIDNDGLSNTAEDNIGTDPYNMDTDGDSNRDDVDLLPLDFHDGWLQKYQFPVSIARNQVQLGEDVLLLAEEPSQALRSFAKIDGEWSEVPAPHIPGNPKLEIALGAAQGNRFIALEYVTASSKKQFHLFDWSTSDGWTQYGPVGVSEAIANIHAAAVEGNTVVVVASLVGKSGYWALVYDVTTAGLVLDNTYSFGTSQPFASSLAISGEYLLYGDYVRKRIIAFNLANGFTSQTIDSYNSASIDQLGVGLFPAGPGKALVDARTGSFWLTLEGAQWSLAPTGLEKSSAYDQHLSGGSGSVLVHSLDSSDYNNQPVYSVIRVSTDAEVGKVNGGLAQTDILTNGRVLVHRRYGGSEELIEILVLPDELPPGC